MRVFETAFSTSALCVLLCRYDCDRLKHVHCKPVASHTSPEVPNAIFCQRSSKYAGKLLKNPCLYQEKDTMSELNTKTVHVVHACAGNHFADLLEDC